MRTLTRFLSGLLAAASLQAAEPPALAIVDGKWHLGGEVTHPGSAAEGLLMNVRMVNATFEDANPATCPADFDPEANADRFIAQIPSYAAHGVRAFTLCLQGGSCGWEGAVNSAFEPDGSLRPAYLARVKRVIDACGRHGVAVILTCFYQRQDQRLRDEAAVRNGVVQAAKWIAGNHFRHVALEIANEHDHRGFDHALIRSPAGQAELIALAKSTAPGLLVAASGLGHGRQSDEVATAGDFILVHFNGTPLGAMPQRLAALRRHGKPIVCNEDDKPGADGARAAELCVENGASWGCMLVKHNQEHPFRFDGAADDPVIYGKLRQLTTAPVFPPPEAEGGWTVCSDAADIRARAGMDPEKLADFREWLLRSDDRPFAAVVVRHGVVALQVERGNSAVADARRVASVSKGVCATVLAIASERSREGKQPMTFDDPAFPFLPWAEPLSDPRKSKITVRQLLNHTSGICPEATGARNEGPWDYVLGHSGDERTARLAFDPGTACGYSTLAFDHAALVCETVTGQAYDEFAIENLFKPLGIAHWTFSRREGSGSLADHVTHSLGMPARDLARLGWCLVNGGRWRGRQVVPAWFVRETAAPTHAATSEELRFKLPAETFSHGWELPACRGEAGRGIPADARFKPGSGGQLLAWVPSLDLVVARQTGGSGDWRYEECLRLACEAVLPNAASPTPR